MLTIQTSISLSIIVILLVILFIGRRYSDHKIVNIHQLPGYTVRRPSKTILSSAGFTVKDDYSSRQTLPSEVENNFTEWIDRGFISIVKDQRHCGGCWAFATASTITDRLTIATNGKWDSKFGLSEQYLLSCLRSLGGCDGGLPAEAIKEMNTKGLVQNTTDASSISKITYYQTNPDGLSCAIDDNHNTCTCDDIANKYTDKKEYKTVGDPHILSQHSDNPNEILDNDLWANIPQNVINDNVLRMKKAIYFNGPIIVGYKVMPDFQSFVPTSDNFYKYKGDGNEQFEGHAVVIVGWKQLKDGTPVWIVKNSWGENWGYGFDQPTFTNPLTGQVEKKYKGGFFNIIQGQNNCFIEANACGGHPDLSAVKEFLPEEFDPTPNYYLSMTLRDIMQKHTDYLPPDHPSIPDHKPTPPAPSTQTTSNSPIAIILIVFAVLFSTVNLIVVLYNMFA